jgi:hypothetical protein
MAKVTIEIVKTFSVEFDTDEIRKEFGTCTNKKMLEIATGLPVDKLSEFDSTARIVEKYELEQRKVKRGIGSY